MSFIKSKFLRYLCPPGNGVYTVHTAKDLKAGLHNKLYGTTELELVQKKWELSFEENLGKHNLCLLGVTLDTGGGIQRGANWGPLFIRNEITEKLNKDLFDLGDTRTIPHLLHDKYLNEQTIQNCQIALYNEVNDLPVSALSITENFCETFYKNYPGKKILALGGDHSVSYSLVGKWIEAKKREKKKFAIIHFDAHTDLLATRLGIDICFGSWAYHMIELLNEPSDLIQFGIRSTGHDRSHWESEHGIQQYWTKELENPSQIIEKVKNYLKENEIEELYISFDIDALDIEYAGATGTPEPGGLKPHQCIQIISELTEGINVSGADLVEVAPFVRSNFVNKFSSEPEATLRSSKIIINKLIEVMS